MKKIKNIKTFLLAVSVTVSISGCATNNPFGVGYEHSSCESSSKFGVCGSPEDIYRYRDQIQKVQNDYLKSGIEQELFFGISHDGRILVKESRTDRWQDYELSKWKDIIEKRVYRQNEMLSNMKSKTSFTVPATAAISPVTSNRMADIPVTNGTDLSVAYRKQGSIIQTRTNVGDLIRDMGLVQRIWVAPVVDKKGDLISAHEIYAVVKDPSWVIGENTPAKPNRFIHKMPTPLSQDVLKTQPKVDTLREDIVQSFNTNNTGALKKEIKKVNTLEDKLDKTIQNFLEE